MLLKMITRKLESEFSSLRFITDEVNHLVTIPSIHDEFGSIEIQDDCNELIVIVGNFTHWHASCYTEDLSEKEKAEEIVDDVINFLHDIFNDKIVIWGSHKGGGGFVYRDDLQGEEAHLDKDKKWVWFSLDYSLINRRSQLKCRSLIDGNKISP
jgi:hypothetical protein